MSWQDNPLARVIIERIASSRVIDGGRRPFAMIVNFTLLPEAQGTAPALASVSQAASRAEPGCLAYTWMQHGESPGRLTLHERWQHIEALEQHFETTHFREVSQMLETMIADTPRIDIYEELGDMPNGQRRDL